MGFFTQAITQGPGGQMYTNGSMQTPYNPPMQDMRARPPQQIGNMMMPRPPQGGIGSFPNPFGNRGGFGNPYGGSRGGFGQQPGFGGGFRQQPQFVGGS